MNQGVSDGNVYTLLSQKSTELIKVPHKYDRSTLCWTVYKQLYTAATAIYTPTIENPLMEYSPCQVVKSVNVMNVYT